MVSWLVVGLKVCVRMSLRRLECKSASLVTIGVESLLVSVFFARFYVLLQVGLHQ